MSTSKTGQNINGRIILPYSLVAAQGKTRQGKTRQDKTHSQVTDLQWDIYDDDQRDLIRLERLTGTVLVTVLKHTETLMRHTISVWPGSDYGS